MSSRKVLIIGQLPIESGGTYTTGIARVVENLYQKNFNGVEVFWYFTNVPHRKATEKCHYKHQYNGFRKLPFQMLWSVISNPIEIIRAWKHYKRAEVNPVRFEFYRANFAKVLSEIKPDLIHIHGAGMQPLYYANKKIGTPIVLTFHGVMYNVEDESTHHFLSTYKDQIAMADYFTVLNAETMRKAIVLGVSKDKCIAIPNGVDTKRFYYSKEQRDLLRQKYSVEPNSLVFMTTGVVIDRKGQFDFIKVLESLNINYQYWIIGKGPDEKKIVDYVEKNHIEDRVKLIGYVDGSVLFKYLSAADVYAHMSTTEGQALSEIEASATGLRVLVRKEIAATVVGDAEHDQRDYFILDMDHLDKDVLRTWLNEKRGERLSKDNYDWALIAQKYSDMYNKILDLNR